MMLHLAQVQSKDSNGKLTLRLLAQKRGDYLWSLLPDDEIVMTSEDEVSTEGTLVLVELSTNRQVVHLQIATNWVLDLVKQYLTTGITPGMLQEEIERAEQWRQSLTLQSQELGRRALEMEARRDKIQELEEKLKQEKMQLELMANELKLNTNS